MDKVWDQMKSGAWYDAEDVSLRQLRASCKAKLQQFNAMPESDRQQAIGILYTLLDAQEGLNIEAPFRCDYGPNIHLGRNFYANFNFSVLDEADVTIGDHVFIGPNVGIYTAIHPLDPKTRRTGLEGAEPVRIGDDVWIGGGAQILPGVTIGSRSVIGAGSVVTRDIPDDVVAAGNPCRVIRSLKGEQDEEDRQV